MLCFLQGPGCHQRAWSSHARSLSLSLSLRNGQTKAVLWGQCPKEKGPVLGALVGHGEKLAFSSRSDRGLGRRAL